MKLTMQLGSRSYDIILKSGCLANLYQFANVAHRKVFILTDSGVPEQYAQTVLAQCPNGMVYTVPQGEASKSLKVYGQVLQAMLEFNMTRKDLLVAVGGGVVGDLGGFCAASYMRGIDFIQVPTTLLACVDSSVGGKTAIDTDYGKNLVGTFYQPKAVFINPNFLKTLDERQFKTGLGEVVKYSFIEKSCKCEEDLNLTNFLSEKAEMIVNRDERVLSKLIEICVKLKISVVEKDEKEGGLRRILNFGHTYGHAIEKITKYKKYTHGEAIVEGMKFAFNLAVKRNLIDKNYKFLAEDVIKKFNFVDIPEFDMEKMIELMEMDKKATFDKIVFILPTDYSTVEAFELDSKDLL